MKKALKSALSLILAIITIVSVFSLGGLTASAVSVTKEEAVSWARTKIGQCLDIDSNGRWCVDLIYYYYQYLGAPIYWGNANDFIYNSSAVPAGWQRITVTSGFVPQPGDIAVWKTNYTGLYAHGQYSTSVAGHIGIVTCADTEGFMTIDQTSSVNCREVWYALDGLQCIIRPNFASSLTATKTLTCDYRVTIPANYKLWLYTSPTATVADEWINEKDAAYRLKCDKQVTLSDGTVRYRFTSGDNKILYLSYNSSVMSLTINHDYKLKSYTPSNCTSYGKSTYVCTSCGDIKYETYSYYSHVYDSSCDTSCNKCGKTRTTTHKYSNSCDTKCNVCNETRSIIHTYSNKCDTECNICGTLRKVVHSYSDDCDEYCNVCYLYRKAKHSYSNAIDRDCNECGAFRQIVGNILLKDKNGHWYYYVNGTKSNDTGLVKYAGKWFYIQKGEWKAITDLVKYKGKYFYIKGGKWSGSTNTLFKKNGKYFAIKSGKWYKEKAIIKYSGKKFYVNKGFAQLKYSGKVKINGKTYKIKKGKAV